MPDWFASQHFTYKDVTTTEAQGKVINQALKDSGFCVIEQQSNHPMSSNTPHPRRLQAPMAPPGKAQAMIGAMLKFRHGPAGRDRASAADAPHPSGRGASQGTALVCVQARRCTGLPLHRTLASVAPPPP
ncbi:hypothetical protein [Streptomyces sp. NPDC056431]|uniref:hypothetical protein n=1 Tax=Streptomyces sp. NPDC056431 TaxID=3345814 RepID=UPI0036A396BD